MASENETVMAVCAEWRECIESADPSVWNNERIAGLVKTTKAQQLAYLDRIEAAWKRDEERAVEHATRHAEAVARDNCRDCIHNPNGKNYEGGNAAAMREALENIAGYAETARCHTEDVHILSFLGEIEGWACSALSAPPRQCDVGTAEEQAERFHDFCESNSSGINGMCNPKCPCIDCFDKCQCLCKWAQMPYKAKRKGENDGSK